METFICKQKVIVSDIGQNYLINNKGYLRILQEAANLASSNVGHGISDIDRIGTTWVLLYWRLKVYKRVKYNDEITIKTWTSFNKKIYSLRNFELYLNNELIAKADSKWVYVDAQNHSIQKISDELIEKYGNNEAKVFEQEFNDKIKMPENLREIYTYTTMKRDLDANHHVNNLTFLDIALEAMPESIQPNEFSNISIIFKKEMLYKDNISCYYQNKENKHYIYLYTKKTNTFNGVIIFEEE